VADLQEQSPDASISRREFLKSAGLLLGGAALGPVSAAASCANTASTPLQNASLTTILPPGSPLPSDVINLKINKRDYRLPVKPDWTLDFVLRDKLGLFGTKVGCDRGECGSCTILSDGTPVLSCLMLAVECEGLSLETIEGLSDGIKLSPLQQKFFDHEAFQCGFCTPGFIMAAKGLLDINPAPSAVEVRQALSGHICTCGNFIKTVEAVVGGV
jgi:aerobic-type carbon monoxide dehydrogenase small subunit (CoxS/CutS family)